MIFNIKQYYYTLKKMLIFKSTLCTQGWYTCKSTVSKLLLQLSY